MLSSSIITLRIRVDISIFFNWLYKSWIRQYQHCIILSIIVGILVIGIGIITFGFDNFSLYCLSIRVDVLLIKLASCI